MSCANILVSVDPGPIAPNRNRLAARMARRLEGFHIGAAPARKPIPVVVRNVTGEKRQTDG